MSKDHPPALFEPPTPRRTFGPVYQGVCKQIRTLTKDGTLDKNRHAGLIVQARSIAESIDRVSGHAGTHQASGMQLAALHERLAAALDALTPATTEADPFQELLDSLNADEGGMPDGSDTEAPHTP